MLKRGAGVEGGDGAGRSMLHRAALQGKVEVAEKLLAAGANPSFRDSRGVTPLHVACKLLHFELMQLLLRRGADPNSPTRAGWTPLLLVLQSSANSKAALSCCRSLLRAGANPTGGGDAPRTALMLAIINGHSADLLELVIKAESKPLHPDENGSNCAHYAAMHGGLIHTLLAFVKFRSELLQSRNQFGETPLDLAVHHGFEEDALLILKISKKDNIPYRNLSMAYDSGSSIFHLAVQRGFTKVVKLFLDDARFNYDAQDQKKNTPLILSSLAGQDKCVKILLENQAKVNTRNESGHSALHAACFQNNPTILEQLLKAGAMAKLVDGQGCTCFHVSAAQGTHLALEVLLKHDNSLSWARNNACLTAFHLAALHGHPLCLAAIMNHCADTKGGSQGDYGLNATTKAGRTALWLAASSGQASCLATLVDRGADVDAVDIDGRTPLLAAAKAGHPHCVSLLCASKANLTASDSKGSTAMSLAVEGRQIQTIKVLLDAGYPVNKRDENGMTALHLAARLGDERCCLLLGQSGAEIEARDKRSRTPLHLAAYSGHQIPSLLLLNMHASASLVDKNGRNAVLAALSVGRKDLARNIEEEVHRLHVS